MTWMLPEYSTNLKGAISEYRCAKAFLQLDIPVNIGDRLCFCKYTKMVLISDIVKLISILVWSKVPPPPKSMKPLFKTHSVSDVMARILERPQSVTKTWLQAMKYYTNQPTSGDFWP